MSKTYASSGSAPAPTDPGRRGPLRKLVRITVVLVSVALVGTVAYYALLHLLTRTDSSSSGIGGDVRSVEIVVDSGDIDVTAAEDGGDAGLERKLTKSLRSPDEEIKKDGDTLRITTTCGDGPGKCASDYDLTVAPGTSVDITTRLGDVNVKGLRAEAAARSDLGDVKLEDVRSDKVDAVTKVGDVTLDGTRFSDAVLRSKAGNIDVRGAGGEFDSLDATSKTGSVVLELPESAGPFDVTADAEIGDREVGVEEDSSGGAKVTAKTKLGDVTVRED